MLVAVIHFFCIYYSLRISSRFETIHTVIQVQNLVLILIAFLVVESGLIAQNFYEIKEVKNSEPEFLPQVLILTGLSVTLVAFLGFYASKTENSFGLNIYAFLCGILMMIFLLFTLLLNFGSQMLSI